MASIAGSDNHICMVLVGGTLKCWGLNNQGQHNILFRGFLKSWEEYTGATITWIDLAQADYNPRLQQAIATGTVDFDVLGRRTAAPPWSVAGAMVRALRA